MADNAIIGDIMSVIEGGGSVRPPGTIWKLEFELDGEVYSAASVRRCTVKREYVAAAGDDITVELVIDRKTWNTTLYPNRDRLRAVLHTETAQRNGGSLVDSAPRYGKYIVSVHDRGSDTLTKGIYNTVAVDEHIEVVVQLIDIVPWNWRLEQRSAIFRNVTVSDVIKLLFYGNAVAGQTPPTATSAEAWEKGDYTGVVGVDMVPAVNERVYEHIIIPPHLKLIDVPLYLQQKYGVYDTGIGYYFQKGLWYFFPNHNCERWADEPARLLVANVDEDALPGIENTFKVENRTVYMISTSRVEHEDRSEELQLNYGNGIRTLRSHRGLDDFTITDKHVTTATRSKNVFEFSMDQRRDGIVHAPYLKDRITDNECALRSSVAQRMGSVVRMVWENSDPDLVYPGMPIRIHSSQDGEVTVLAGIVTAAIHESAVPNEGLMDTVAYTNTALEIFALRVRS